MKSNPHVYPYTPFQDLANKEVKDNFVSEKEVTFQDIKKELEKVENPTVEVSGETAAERIFSIFLNDELRFGPKEFLLENKESWIKQLNYFIEKGEKIQFTILGFPFKIPVPLKTDRILPDMGEMLAMNRLNYVMELCNKEYENGVKVTIFSEGGFDKSVGVPHDESVAYHEFLVEAAKQVGFDKNVEVVPLSDMEDSVDNFEELYQKKISDLKELFASGDEKYLAKYEGTKEAVYRIVSTTGMDRELLMDVYNENLSDEDISSEALEVRKDIEKRMQDAIFMYHAYLMVRDDIDFIEKVVPHAITLSVSPKPNRLGVIPIRRELKRLPYHSVPVLDSDSGLFSTEYLIDIKREESEFTKVLLKGDADKAPFYYIKK